MSGEKLSYPDQQYCSRCSEANCLIFDRYNPNSPRRRYPLGGNGECEVVGPCEIYATTHFTKEQLQASPESK